MDSHTIDDTEHIELTSPQSGRRAVYELPEGVSPSVAVIEAIAATTGVDPMDVPPLYEVVDPDALDDLFAPMYDGTPRLDGEVGFTLGGCQVTVSGNGRIVVEAFGPAVGSSGGFVSEYV